MSFNTPVSVTKEKRQQLRDDLRNIGVGVALIAGFILSFDEHTLAAMRYGVTVHNAAVGGAGLGVVLLAVSYFIPNPKAMWHEMFFRPLRKDELDNLHLLIRDYAGGTIVPLPDRMKILDRNRCTFFLLERKNIEKYTSTIVGYTAIYPLNKRGCDDVLHLRRVGGQLTPNDIVKTSGRASGCYIGFAWAEDEMARGYLLDEIRKTIESLPKQPGDFLIATRPTTEEALKVLKRRNFCCIRDGKEPRLGEVCKRRIDVVAP